MKKFVKGALILTLGGFVCKFIGAFFRIPLANILGSTGMGYYQMVFPVYSFALVFVSGGIPSTLSRFISVSRANNKREDIVGYFLFALKLSFLIGVFFALVFLIFAKQIAFLQGSELVYGGYYVVALSIVFSSLLCAFRGLFQGYENMLPTFFSQVFEQIFKLVFGLLFSTMLVKYGAVYGFIGALIGICVSEIITFLYIITYSVFFNKKEKLFSKHFRINQLNKKSFLKFAFPITLTSLVLPLTGVVTSMMVVNLLMSEGLSNITATAIYGIQSGMINSIISFPTVISTALATSLIPSLTYSVEKNENKEVGETIKNCFKTIWILTFPCMIGLYVLAPNILKIAFGSVITESLFDVATGMMRISCLSILFVCLVQISTVILQVLKKQWYAFCSLMLLFAINTVLLFVLIKTNNVYGMSLANLFAYSVVSVLNLCLISKHFSVKMRFLDLVIPVFSSIFMGVICYQLNVLLKNFNMFFSSLFIVFVGVVTYFLPIFLFKVLEINNLKIKLQKKQKF